MKKLEGKLPDGQAKFLTQRLVPESWACHLDSNACSCVGDKNPGQTADEL